jgi:hypothetical protein
MLLEYTEETQELQLGEKAVEIRRRVAGRNLRKAIESGGVSATSLIDIKKDNKQQLSVLTKDNLIIRDAEISSRVAVSRSDQHLSIVNDFRVVDRDLTRLARLGKTKIDTLNELEKRILVMRRALFVTTASTIEEDMQKELLFNGKAGVDKLFRQCERCGQRVLADMLDTHSGACQRLLSASSGSGDVKQMTGVDNFFLDITTFTPQPPRNFKVLSKGCSFIRWAWDPPVMDGGLAVIDYEIRYKVKMPDSDEVTGRPKVTVQERPPFSTSIWCTKNPVAHYGYNINGLLAGCEYYDFEIRALNRKGYSEWSNMLERALEKRVCTDDPDPPTAPLLFRVDRVSSSCMYLSWSAPLFDGGRPISGYVVSYVVMEREPAAHSNDVFVERLNSFKVPNDTR